MEDDSSDDDSIDENEVGVSSYLLRQLVRLHRDDPFVTSLTIGAGNWAVSAGNIIGKSRYLKRLTIMNLWCEDLYSCLAQNRSIESIELILSGECEEYNNLDVFRILRPFFEFNSNLRHIDVTLTDLNMDLNILFNSLVSGLLKCNHLVSFRFLSSPEFAGDALEADNRAASLFESLSGKSSLLRIAYGDFLLSTGCRAIANLLNNPACKLQRLQLNEGYIDDDGVTILCNSSIMNSTLRELDFFGNTHITASGLRTLSTVLSHPMCSLKFLAVGSNNVDDEGVIYLGDALAVNKTLSHLSIRGNIGITLYGWRGFSNCLRSPFCALEMLNIGGCDINGTSAGAILSALVGNSNSCLQELHMPSHDRTLADTDWNLLSCLLCDKTSIDRTYFSNHQLHTVDMTLRYDINLIPSDIASLLAMNANMNKSEVWRAKILKYHYCGSNSDIRPFAQMSESVLPIAIEWIGRDEAGFQLMYELVKGMTNCLLSAKRTTNAGEKRKHEL